MCHARACLTIALATTLVLSCAGPTPTGTGAPPTRPKGAGSLPGATAPLADQDAGAPTSPAPGSGSPGAGLPVTSPPGVTPAAGSVPPLVPTAIATLVGKAKAPAGLLANNGAGLISDKGGSLVSDQGGGVVSNNGGKVVSNNGGALVSNNGGGYRLRQATGALEQFYVRDALVELIDADGRPVTGPDGTPLTTRTGADGGYAFTAALPARALVVRVTPPGATGALTRLVARSTRTADVDLSSALVASYVLAKYVTPQADRQGTLEKLPGEVEAETVVRAGEALSAGALAAGALPVSLEPGALLTSAEALRRADARFDTQMEVVREILIAAGVSNLGAGMRATDLFFRRFQTFHALPDGGFYAYGPYERVLWGVAADGTVSHVAGRSGVPPAADPASRAGLEARAIALEHVVAMRRDDQGRLMVAEQRHGVWRIEADGRISELTPAAALTGAMPQGGGPPLTLRRDGAAVWVNGGALWTVPPGGTATQLLALGGEARRHVVELSGGRWMVGDRTGMTVYEAGQAPVTQWARSDIPASIPGDGLLEYREPWIDEAGNVFYEAAGSLHVVRPDGADQVIAPTSAMKQFMHQGWVGADGQIHLVDDLPQDSVSAALVWRFDAPGGKQTLVAGTVGLAPGFLPGGVLPLLRPEDMDVATDGTLFVADAGAILKVRQGGPPEVVLARDATLPGAPERLIFTGVRVTAAGRLMVRALGKDRELVFRQTDGGWDLPVVVAEDWVNLRSLATMAWDVTPDGTIFVSANDFAPAGPDGSPSVGRVLRVRPGAVTPEELVGAGAGVGWITKLAAQPDGSLRLATEQTSKKFLSADFFMEEIGPGRWAIAADGAATKLASDAWVPEAFDAAGNGYAGDVAGFQDANGGDRRIRRLRPDGTATVVAGQPGGPLGGKALDDSIGEASGLALDGAGNLYIRDEVRRQIRRLSPGSF